MLPNEILQYFAKYIEHEIGVVYSEHNFFQLQNRLEEIAKLLGVDGPEALYQQAKQGIHGAFKKLLLDVATNNETSFFRDPKVFKTIEKILVPVFSQYKEKIRIWSAASSTGQEALSLAMLLLEASKKLPQKIDFHITGTDISERALERARSAKYSQLEVQRGLAEPLLVQYFKKDDHDTWTATQELRAHTSFQHFNLKESFSFPQKFHLILCRNVLIYHSVEGKKQILNKIEQAMTPQGFFIMGSGESLLGLSDAFECASLENGVIYRTKQKTTATAA